MSERFQLSALDNGRVIAARVRTTGLIDSAGLHLRGPSCHTDELRALCLFIGYPRSGHSAVGSLIDAHPDAVVAHGLDAVRYIARDYSPPMLAHMIARNADRFNRRGRRLTAYAYSLPGSWQGHIRTLRVIGAQEARRTAERLAGRPALLADFEARSGVRVKLVHVIRNPYDNITTWATRRLARIEPTIDAYFGLCCAVKTILEHRRSSDVMHVHHERLLAQPRDVIAAMCDFLGLEPEDTYLDRSSQLLYRAPHVTRHTRTWPPSLVARVAREMTDFTFLRGYSWES